MSTIGVGQALRRQQQLAERRERPRLGDGHSAGLGFDPSPVCCVGCGAAIARGDVFGTAEGEVCPTCFVEAQPEPAATGAVSLPLVGAWLFLGLMGSMIASMQVEFFVGKGGMGWMLLGMLATVFALFAGLDGARALRDALNPVPLDDDEEEVADRRAQLTGALALGASLLAGLLGPAITLLPYLIGLEHFRP